MEDKRSLGDRLGELNNRLASAMAENNLDEAESIRIQIADLMDDGLLNKSIEDLDFNNEFVRQWYADSD